MTNHSLKYVIRMLVASFVGIIVSLGSFLPGGPNVKPSSELPKSLMDFLLSCPSAIFKHRSTFSQARKAQIGGDTFTARKLYNELLVIYPNNSVIEHNLSLMNNTYGPTRPTTFNPKR